MAIAPDSVKSSGGLQKPLLNFWQIWNISFGFLGVQIGYSLQNANTSRILSAIGADPHHLSLFWLAAPVAGLIVQPIVGLSSDKTWTRLGRRIPFILGGAIVSAAAMFFMPNSEHFAELLPPLFFGATMLLLMDTSFNVTMQPFRALVSDMVPDSQRNKGYSIQSLLINTGAVVGSFLPFILTAIGVANEPSPGNKVAPSVIWSFYFGGGVLLLTVLWTSFKTKEYPPEEYAKYNRIESTEKEKSSFWSLVLNMPKPMKQLAFTQFFSWFALFLMWVFTTQGIAENVWNLDAKELKFAQGVMSLKEKDSISDIQLIELKNKLEKDGNLNGFIIPEKISKSAMEVFEEKGNFPADLTKKSELKNQISMFNEAGNWTGVIFGMYSLFAALYSLILSGLANRFGRRNTYAFSLVMGGIGLLSMLIIKGQFALLIPMIGIGIAWAAILAMPYAILSSSLPAEQTGVYMGIFNATITIPQIVAGFFGGVILSALGGEAINIIGLAGGCMILAGVLAKLVITSEGH